MMVLNRPMLTQGERLLIAICHTVDPEAEAATLIAGAPVGVVISDGLMGLPLLQGLFLWTVTTARRVAGHLLRKVDCDT